MVLIPMTGDFFAAADPDVRVLHDVFEKASECADTSRSSYHAAVHRHRQKFRRRRSFGVKPIEGIAHVGKPVVGCRETPAWAARPSLVSKVWQITRCRWSPTVTQYGRSSLMASQSYRKPPYSTTSRRVLTLGRPVNHSLAGDAPPTAGSCPRSARCAHARRPPARHNSRSSASRVRRRRSRVRRSIRRPPGCAPAQGRRRTQSAVFPARRKRAGFTRRRRDSRTHTRIRY